MKYLTVRLLIFVLALLAPAMASLAQDRVSDTSGISPDMASPGKISDDSENRRDLKDADRKPQLLLAAQSGDGLAKLSWRLVNLPPNADEKAFRFTVHYGTEADSQTKTLQVGTTFGYTLRELRNYQPYYIQVVANTKEQQAVFRSNDVRVIPLADEDRSSRLEKAFSKKTPTLLDKNEPDLFVRDLRQFGYDFFRNGSPTSGGLDSLPVAHDYILGSGDTLSLNLWGAINNRYELTIDRNGEIMIPKVGIVRLWGLTYEQGRDAVNKAIGRYFKNYEMSMTLGRLRTIQVFVVGDVEAPGGYSVSSLSTIINALSAAGGPSRNGSLRTIKVTRTGQPPQDVDLYDMFLSGDRSKDVRLQNGDTVFVPVIGPVVAVAGEVRRPAIYELKGAATLPEVLKMAGGIAATGYTGRIQVERVVNNSSRVALDYEPKDGSIDSALGTVVIMDRDMIKVFPVQAATRQVVSLKGNILRPGEFEFKPGMRLTDLIPSTQVLLPESYLDSVEITRLQPPDYRRELLTVSLRRALAGGEQDNIVLQEQDTVKVFSRWEMEEKPVVTVNGAVVKPGTFDYQNGMTVRDLVTAAGSPRRNAYFEQAELSRIVISGDKAESQRLQLNLGKAMAGDPQYNLPLQADDVLIVRGVTDWSDASDKFITLGGEVRFPGIYSLAPGEKLSSVIARAGGYSEKAYLRAAKFLRRSVREEQQKRLEEVAAKVEKDVTQKQAALTSVAASKEELEATKASLEAVMKGVERMRGLKAEGRVVIKLRPLEELRNSDYDLVLEGGDELTIPPRPSVVNVMGQVFNPISLVYLPEASDVDSYLKQAGGPTSDAETSEMYIIKTDGTVFSRQQSSFGLHWSDDARRWSFGSFSSYPLEPGDALVVPQKIERIAWLREIKDITTIMSQIALTAGTILIGLR
jgi:protein involved in polysaccharide export with SLBB domain